MTTSPHANPLRLRVPVGVAVLVALSACSTGTTSPTPPANPTASTPSSVGAPASSAAATPHPAIVAYLAMWREVVTASHTSDWRAPELDDHAIGEALTTITTALRNDHTKGIIAKGALTHRPALSTLKPADEPTVAVVVDCADSSTWLKYRAKTDQLVDDAPGGQRRITAEVTLSAPETWKVSKFVVQEVGSCR